MRMGGALLNNSINIRVFFFNSKTHVSPHFLTFLKPQSSVQSIFALNSGFVKSANRILEKTGNQFKNA